jgi:hypothetical protein
MRMGSACGAPFLMNGGRGGGTAWRVSDGWLITGSFGEKLIKQVPQRDQRTPIYNDSGPNYLFYFEFILIEQRSRLGSRMSEGNYRRLLGRHIKGPKAQRLRHTIRVNNRSKLARSG